MCFPLHESDKGYRALPQSTLSTHPWEESVNGLKLKYGKSLQTLGSKSGACVPHIRKRKVKLEVNQDGYVKIINTGSCVGKKVP